jgi:hypothetical protein
MSLCYIDSGVLIAAARGQGHPARQAAQILADPARRFVSSDFVRLEVLPKSIYFGKHDEVEYYETFFASVHLWIACDAALCGEAFQIASTAGMNAIDALHVAAAVRGGANELVTSEGTTKAIHRVQGIQVISIQP